MAVVARELAHWKLGHNICLIAAQQAVNLANFMLFALFRNSATLHVAFGFNRVKPVVISLLLFMTVLTPMNKLLLWLFNLLSRRCAPWLQAVMVSSCVQWPEQCNDSIIMDFLPLFRPEATQFTAVSRAATPL